MQNQMSKVIAKYMHRFCCFQRLKHMIKYIQHISVLWCKIKIQIAKMYNRHQTNRKTPVNVRIAHLRIAPWWAILRWAILSTSFIRIAHPNYNITFHSVCLISGGSYSYWVCLCTFGVNQDSNVQLSKKKSKFYWSSK